MTLTDELTPQQRRHARTKSRLRDALCRLSSDPTQPLTVAALAREAGIGRNAIYTGHVDVLGELRDLAAQRDVSTGARYRDKEESRVKIRKLERDTQILATQNASLLRRALEAEERLKRSEDRNAGLLREISKLRAPVVMHCETEGQPGRHE
ncbi:MAG: hypothetical protein F4Z34_04320 [Acidimicrobiaceae bacterium]|nr:hypothetical protein [Acidimicrobiaceae bacterium]